MQYPWLEIAKRLQAIAQAGLAYNTIDYDVERYTEIQELAAKIVADLSETDVETVRELFLNETGYRTPKVDVRAVVFRERRILLVREKVDGRWALPGGWADVGYTPSEVAAKETWEEAGLRVTPLRLLGVLDRSRQAGPPSIAHIYKIFIRCVDTPDDASVTDVPTAGSAPTPGSETLDAAFFEADEIPPLSLGRTTPQQIERCFGFLDEPDGPCMVD